MNHHTQKNQEIIQKRDDRLKNFIERLEILSEEKNNLNFDIKEVFSEAKSSCCDTTIIRKILALRNMNINERLEQEKPLKTYKNVLGIY